jgi:hypothetical protein
VPAEVVEEAEEAEVVEVAAIRRRARPNFDKKF